jgi:hypothetical protein
MTISDKQSIKIRLSAVKVLQMHINIKINKKSQRNQSHMTYISNYETLRSQDVFGFSRGEDNKVMQVSQKKYEKYKSNINTNTIF